MTEQDHQVAVEVVADAAEWEGHLPQDRADNVFVHNVAIEFRT